MTEDVNIDPNEIDAFARLVAHLANSRFDGDVYERLRTAMKEAFATVREHAPLADG
jgi:histone H3/H4